MKTYRVQTNNKEMAKIIAVKRNPDYIVGKVEVIRPATRSMVGDYRVTLRNINWRLRM